MLDDLADDGGVRFFLPFDEDFPLDAWPKDFDAYAEYRRRSIEFIEARNIRIALLDL